MHNSMKLDNKNKTDVTGDNMYSHVSTTERYIIWGMFRFLYKRMLYLVIPQEEEKISTEEKKQSFYFIPWEKNSLILLKIDVGLRRKASILTSSSSASSGTQKDLSLSRKENEGKTKPNKHCGLWKVNHQNDNLRLPTS